MKAALALSVCCLSASALAQDLPKVPVYQPYQIMQITSEPVMLKDRTLLDVSTFGLGLPGSETMAKAISLKSQGYEYTTETHVLECRGRTIIGFSRPYARSLTLRKKTDQFSDRIDVQLASNYQSAHAFVIDRTIHYHDVASTPTAVNLQKQLEDKYGEANSVTKDNNGFPTGLRWEFRYAVLEVRMTLASSHPSLVSYYTTKLTRTLRGKPVDYAAKDQESVCAETRPLDEANIRKLNERQQTGPKL